jgi:hypothetical protein
MQSGWEAHTIIIYYTAVLALCLTSLAVTVWTMLRIRGLASTESVDVSEYRRRAISLSSLAGLILFAGFVMEMQGALKYGVYYGLTLATGLLVLIVLAAVGSWSWRYVRRTRVERGWDQIEFGPGRSSH